MPTSTTQQLENLTTLLQESECLLYVGAEFELDTKTMQQLRKELRAFNATIFNGKKSLLRIAAKNLWTTTTWKYKEIEKIAKGKSSIIFLQKSNKLQTICTIINAKSITSHPKVGQTYKEDLWCKAGISDLNPTETGGLRAYFMVPSRILRGKICFMQDFIVIPAGVKTDEFRANFAKRLGLNFIFPFQVQQIINLKENFIYPSKICNYTENTLGKTLASGLFNIKSIESMISSSSSSSTQDEIELFDYPDEFIPNSLENFKEIQMQSNCLFAKRANLRGNVSCWNSNLSFDENCKILLPEIKSFISCSISEKLDGFLIELPSDCFALSVEEFESFTIKFVQNIEKITSDDLNSIPNAWYFNIFNSPCFVTNFAPCYPESSSRFTFNCAPSSCFILLQPKSSFERYKVLEKHCPKSFGDKAPVICDKIRENFLANGRTYVAF